MLYVSLPITQVPLKILQPVRLIDYTYSCIYRRLIVRFQVQDTNKEAICVKIKSFETRDRFICQLSSSYMLKRKNNCGTANTVKTENYCLLHTPLFLEALAIKHELLFTFPKTCFHFQNGFQNELSFSKCGSFSKCAFIFKM